MTSAALAAGVVYAGSQDGYLYAYKATSGALVWKGTTGGAIDGAPAIQGRTIFVGSEDGRLYAFDAKCGSIGSTCAPIWSASTGGAIKSAPALAYNEVYAASADGKLYAWSTLPCTTTPPCGPSWTASVASDGSSSPVVADGLVYAASASGSLVGLSARGLTIAWSTDVGSAIHSSPIVANGSVYVGSDDHSVHAFTLPGWTPPRQPDPATLVPLSAPIRHIVVLYQENHSFDNVLGRLCVDDGRCDGATTGQTADNQTIPLVRAGDVPPNIPHSMNATNIAINGGQMNGFSLWSQCNAASGYACYEQYATLDIPNLAALARRFAISDRTFELSSAPSWGGHMNLAAAQRDGFTGDNPRFLHSRSAPGWGCDSNLTAPWQASAGAQVVQQPACIPWIDGSGPFTSSPVPWVPTIMDRLDQAGYTWSIYTGELLTSSRWLASYIWAICPTFADCLYSAQSSNMKIASQVISDANSGSLPNLSLVMPSMDNSQHNLTSMIRGDNWISSVVGAIENGPDWNSTAIFITYDDCGCFYDHVPPPPGLGVRVPMVVVSPYAKPAYTDSTNASFASILAYIEHTINVSSLATADTNAYDYSNIFDYSQRPLAGARLSRNAVPRSSLRWIAHHPQNPHDPT